MKQRRRDSLTAKLRVHDELHDKRDLSARRVALKVDGLRYKPGSGAAGRNAEEPIPVVLQVVVGAKPYAPPGIGGGALLSLIGMFTNLSNANIKVSSWLLKGTV